MRDAGGSERLRGEIQVRQRMFVDDRGAIAWLKASGYGDQFFLSIADGEPQRIGTWSDQHRPRAVDGVADFRPVNFVEPWPPGVQPLVKSRSERGLGRDDIEPLQPWHPREQIEIGDEQPVWIGNPIG